MREPEEARPARNACWFAQALEDVVVMNLPKPEELLEDLKKSGKVRLDGWSINLHSDQIWVTNPYGLDCAVLPPDVGGCERVLHAIGKDTHDREWGSL